MSVKRCAQTTWGSSKTELHLKKTETDLSQEEHRKFRRLGQAGDVLQQTHALKNLWSHVTMWLSASATHQAHHTGVCVYLCG